MILIGIKRKSDGEIIATREPGVFTALPDGYKPDQIEYVSILIPERNEMAMTQSTEKDAIGNMARHLGMNISDFIEMCAKIFGIEPCSACQMTKIILYSIRAIGWLKAIKLIFKTRTGIPFTKKEQLVLDTLQKTPLVTYNLAKDK